MALYKVEICGVNTAKLPLIDNEEKDELFRRIKSGDAGARELYIEGNLRLVLSIIQRFSNSNENVDDLFQIGCIGLMKAIDNFDTEQGVRFSTYAVPMIIGEIRRYLRDNNSIRVSRSLRDNAYRAIYAKEAFIRENNREPTIEELSEVSGLSREDIVNAMDAVQTPVSLYEPVYRPDGTLESVDIKAGSGAPELVTKRIIQDMDRAYFPVKTIIPSTEIVHDRVMLELFRGCIRGCRFCQAGYAYRPVRSRSPELLAKYGKAACEESRMTGSPPVISVAIFENSINSSLLLSKKEESNSIKIKFLNR